MSAICQRCAGRIKSQQVAVTCADCEKSFHGSCVKVNASDIAILSERGEHWICATCHRDRRLKRSDESPLPGLKIPDRRGGGLSLKESLPLPQSRSPAVHCSSCRQECSDEFVQCKGNCRGFFHISCAAFDHDDYNLVMKKKNLCFICDNCLPEGLDVARHVEHLRRDMEHTLSNLVKDMQKSILSSLNSTLESKLSNLKSGSMSIHDETSSGETLVSYSSILQSRAEPGVLVKPKTKQRNSVTKTDLRSRVDPVRNDIQISKIKNARDGAVLISCKNNDDNLKLKRLVEESLASQYEVKTMSGIKPRLRIGGITDELSVDELKDVLLKMNSSLFTDSSQCEILSIKTTRKNSEVYQALVRVDRVTYNRVIKFGYVFIGYNYCPVFDAVDAIRCFNCCQYGHLSNRCNADPCCPRCGELHKVSECKIDNSSLKCSNCIKLNAATGSNVDVNHAAWDTECVVYKNACAKMRECVLLPSQSSQ